jgi:MFS family permease
VGELFDTIVNFLYYGTKLIGMLIGGIFGITMLYLMVLRPIIKLFVTKDNKKKVYWLSIILLLIFGFVLGPILFVYLTKLFRLGRHNHWIDFIFGRCKVIGET